MNKAQILFVGDFDKGFLKHVSSENWEIKHQPNSEQAILLFDKERIDLIVAKDKLEGLNGYQLCLFIKSNPQTANLPFIILGDKKLKNNEYFGSSFARPDRLAEIGEVLKKPQSLVKLITEDLKEFSKNVANRPKTVQLLPASSALSTQCDLLEQISGELLLERAIATRMFSLLRRPGDKNLFLNEFFTAVKDILKADLCGIGISGLHKPWLAFSASKNINQASFDTLIKMAKENFVLAQDLVMLNNPTLTESGGSIISDFILVPAIHKGFAPGLLLFAKCENQKFTALERVIINYLEQYSNPIFEFLQAEQEMDKLREREAVRAAIDPLTGLYNIEFLIGFLQQQLLFSFRNKLPVSLLMIDVDRFSQINDALGQSVADTILVKLAERILSIVRGSDLLARYSSDKFVIVLPNTPLKGARVLAEKLRLEVEQANFLSTSQPGPSITVSVGLAEYDPHDLNPEAILKEAKTALQKAKEAGRNKVAT